jgi:hypothetical protein
MYKIKKNGKVFTSKFVGTGPSSYEKRKKMERYLRVNLLELGPRLMKKEFTGPWSHKG